MKTEIFERNGEQTDDTNDNILGHKLLAMFYQMIGDLKEELNKENAVLFVELTNSDIRIEASEELKQKIADALSKI